jgi:addiction module HigA family antidote
MSATNYIPAFPVPHPGEILKDEILPAAELRPAEAARRIGVSPQSLHAILHGKAGISADMALRLAALFGNSPMHWLNMQALYDLQRSSQRLQADIDHIEPVAA